MMRFMRLGFLTAMAMTAAATASAQQGNTISAPIQGLRNNVGEVRCGLFNSDATFRKPGQQMMGVAVPIVNQQATCVFNNVPPGTYAIAAFHAEKNETQLQTNFLGIPKEGYGFSRNPSTTFGPPGFSDAAYAYAGGATSWPISISY
jgi:uncharacterized protein (DUF2141 family)